MRKLFFLAAIVAPFSLSAQNVIIKQDVNKDFEKEEHGPNRKFYNSTFSGFGMLFGEPDSAGSAINWYRSFYYENGSRHKRQFGSFFALGHDASVNLRSFSIAQDSSKTFGGIQQHKAERFFNVNGNLTLFMRFNFLPNRGNHLGRYLDLGGFVEYSVITRHMVRDKLQTSTGYNHSRSYLRGLQYVNRLNYGATVRIGFGHISFFGQYRYSDMFKKTETINYQELPRYTAGITFDMPG
jgi:hypothetical protein